MYKYQAEAICIFQNLTYLFKYFNNLPYASKRGKYWRTKGAIKKCHSSSKNCLGTDKIFQYRMVHKNAEIGQTQSKIV